MRRKQTLGKSQLMTKKIALCRYEEAELHYILISLKMRPNSLDRQNFFLFFLSSRMVYYHPQFPYTFMPDPKASLGGYEEEGSPSLAAAGTFFVWFSF